MKKAIFFLFGVAFCVTMLLGGGKTSSVANAASALKGYPKRPIQFIVNRGAGGTTDGVARAVSTSLMKDHKIVSVVQNLEGGDGLIGANEAMTAKPDGYTFLVIGNTEIPNILVKYKGAAFTAGDIVPVCELASKSNILVMKSDSKLTTIEEFIKFAKAKPGEITVAIAGTNTAYVPKMIEDVLRIKLTVVNAGSGNTAYQEVLGGHVECAIVGSDFYSNAKAAKMLVIADTANRKQHVPDAADTFLSKGYKVVVENYNYMCALKGTPTEIVKFMSDSIGKSMSNGSLSKALDSIAQKASFMGYKEFTPLFKKDLKTMMDINTKLNQSLK
jgi:tripartite-type tricarboxylate transporter receptor subunit TctC